MFRPGLAAFYERKTQDEKIIITYLESLTTRYKMFQLNTCQKFKLVEMVMHNFGTWSGTIKTLSQVNLSKAARSSNEEPHNRQDRPSLLSHQSIL